MAIPVNVSTFSAADPSVTATPGTAIIVVNGHNVEVPEHFRVHVAEKMAHLQRYDDKIIRYAVELFHENNHRQAKLCQRVEITGIGNGPVVRAGLLRGPGRRARQAQGPFTPQPRPPPGAPRPPNPHVGRRGHRDAQPGT